VIEVTQGYITKLDVGAIVNPTSLKLRMASDANAILLGGGVLGSIYITLPIDGG